MRIVVWNCRMGLGQKLVALQSLHPDIAIVPEAADPSRIANSLLEPRTMSYCWVGSNAKKGLGTLALEPFAIAEACQVVPNLEWILPLSVSGPMSFSLLAVWAMNHRARITLPGPDEKRQVDQAVGVYDKLFSDGPVVVAGDFNNSVIWDKGNRPGFRRTVASLAERGLVSAYHAVLDVPLGKEPHPTLYWRTPTVERFRYHVDYCFIPKAWLPWVSIEVGTVDEWIATGRSDHVPLIIDIAEVTLET